MSTARSEPPEGSPEIGPRDPRCVGCSHTSSCSRSPAPTPSCPREHESDLGSTPLLAIDAARSEVVGQWGSRTWTWDGSTWEDKTGAGPTSARDSDMAYDLKRKRVVRFGGYTDGSGSSEIDETWEWDGATWTKVTPTQSPSPRGGHSMTYDTRREHVLLFGGYDHNETWEYDGKTWTQRLTETAPPGSFPNGLVYDEKRDRSVFYASDGSLWEYFPVGEACEGSADCPSGSCVDGICCDRACPSDCGVCSVAAGGTKDGICELMADASVSCELPAVDAVDPGSEPAGAAKPKKDKGCSVSGRGTTGASDGYSLSFLALALMWRLRSRNEFDAHRSRKTL